MKGMVLVTAVRWPCVPSMLSDSHFFNAYEVPICVLCAGDAEMSKK